jgi:hypothetical protein
MENNDTRTPSPPANSPHLLTGPFETEQEVRDHPVVRAIYEAARADLPRGLLAKGNHEMLSHVLRTAGVELGAYDERIIGWLAGYEPGTCAVIAGLIARAHAAQPPALTETQLATVLDALAEALRSASSDAGQFSAHPSPMGQIGRRDDRTTG